MQQVLGEELPIFGTNPISEGPTRSVTRSVAARKRKEAPETPITIKNLRRSSRLELINNGHRSTSSTDPVSSNTRAAKKKVASQSSLAGNLLLPPTILSNDFPGLDELDKSNEIYPQLSVAQIQEVATSRCGLAPSEVTAELLLARSEGMPCPSVVASSDATTNLINE